MVVDRDRQNLLGFGLSNDVVLEKREDLLWLRKLREFGVFARSARELLFDDLVA